MTGTYDIGDVVVVRPVDTEQLGVGDVITFQPVSDDPALTTHRIVEVDLRQRGAQFVTRGDANNAVDLGPVKPAQVMGEVWYSVPRWATCRCGWPASWLGTVVQLLAVALLLYGGWFIVAGLLERRRRKRCRHDRPTRSASSCWCSASCAPRWPSRPPPRRTPSGRAGRDEPRRAVP